MVSLPFYTQGEYLAANGVDWIAFEIDSGKSRLPTKRLFALPMELNSSQLNDSVTLALPCHQWFDAVDFTQISSSTQIDLILFNISSTISLKG